MAKFLDTLEIPPYVRIKVLGCGPYSVVDEVQNLATGAVFARKTINYPNQREYTPFVTEIEIMKKLNHPHIVRFIDAYALDKSVSILMSPVADFDLGYFMSKHQTLEPIPLDSIIQWFSCLVSSVEYLHGKSIKHQDIKPSNILIKRQKIVLADFGIAKTFVDSEPTASTSGDMTKKYCSPETAQDGLRGRKADIFSLGCVFLEMFSLLIYKGQPAFGEFQESHFLGDGTYQENLPMAKLWIEILRGEQAAQGNPILCGVLDSCEAMLERSSKNRPSADDLSVNLPPGQCCLPAENVSDTQPVLEERQVVPSSDMEPIPHQNLPGPAHLDDPTTTANEQASQRGPAPSKVHGSVQPPICHHSWSLNSVYSGNIDGRDACCLMINKMIGSNIFSSFLIMLAFIGALLLALNSYPTPSLLKIRSHGPRVPSLPTAAWRSNIINVVVLVEENRSFGTFANDYAFPNYYTSTIGDPFKPFDADLVELGSEWPSSIDLSCSRCLTYITDKSTGNHDSNFGSGLIDALDQPFINASQATAVPLSPVCNVEDAAFDKTVQAWVESAVGHISVGSRS
jgi:serine/threonine protein kinase